MLRHALGAAAAALACACAPAPMAASEAGEHLARFAAGTIDGDVCTPEGRTLLRSAVRGYGAELARAGVAWPALPNDEETLRSADMAVAFAFAAGLLEASDFQASVRRDIRRLALIHLPQLSDMRAAAHVACSEVAELQQAALRFAEEAARHTRMLASVESGRVDPERLRRQRERLENARGQVEALAAAIQEEIATARRRRG